MELHTCDRGADKSPQGVCRVGGGGGVGTPAVTAIRTLSEFADADATMAQLAMLSPVNTPACMITMRSCCSLLVARHSRRAAAAQGWLGC